jgi:LDH2 family malate/lactate/ureidoglycolate dehydrogenase
MDTHVTLSYAEVTSAVKHALRRVGADEANAKIVAHHLALAEASGTSTHGLAQLSSYVIDIENDRLVPDAKPRVIRDSAVTAVVHGGWTFGQVGAETAVGLAVDKAKASGVAVCGLVACHHIGRLGHYVEWAAERGCTTSVWVGGLGEEDPRVVPHGGADRIVGTNPIAFGFPSLTTDPFVFDFATSSIAGNKIVEARRRAVKLPVDSIVDANGEASTDPEDFFDGGALLPFGGHKGYAINLAAEWLGRILIDSASYAEDSKSNAFLRRQGVLFLAISVDALADGESVRESADEMHDRITASRPARDHSRVTVPGMRSAESRRSSFENGITVDAEIWDQVRALAEP